ncbi:hypothetical protein RJ640_023172 [Escallonia rubra]|uniref:Uncharacterized protein n=1 Tax=Escallonia rubra TaxID=112253 RepID=A0AA88UIW0_9ASTE|nr:hypothetical protein RJ640_023172 [Escallonia rubra]
MEDAKSINSMAGDDLENASTGGEDGGPNHQGEKFEPIGSISDRCFSFTRIYQPPQYKPKEYPPMETLMLAYQSLGVVYGDLGTSPTQVLSSITITNLTEDDYLGILSLIVWTLTLPALIKYVFIVLHSVTNDHASSKYELPLEINMPAEIGIECKSTTFSMKQSVALDCFPRVHIIHTSSNIEGQIYYTLMILGIGLVVGFKGGVELANAYGNSPSMVKEFKNAIAQEFEMMDIGLMSYYLGIEVKQRDDSIFISLEGYAKEIVKKFKMDDANPASTPVECEVKLSRKDIGEKVDPTFFQEPKRKLEVLDMYKTGHFVWGWAY